MGISAWHSHWMRSFEYMEVLNKTRERGLWPVYHKTPPSFIGKRILIVRRDRFGDMMVSIPFLQRLLNIGADIKVLATAFIARDILTGVGLDCYSEISDAVSWEPHWIIFLESCRHLRSQRHPERWDYIRQVLIAFQGSRFLVPTMRKAESMSYFVGSFCRPFQMVTAFSVLDTFAAKLKLPVYQERIFKHWICSSQKRACGSIVFNLSAGKPGIMDRRDIPIAFWNKMYHILHNKGDITFICQPGDEHLAQELTISDKKIICSTDIVEIAEWLGQQKLLISSETGLCHLARNLDLPMVVISPPRQVPYWYPPDYNVRLVLSKIPALCSPEETSAKVLELLEIFY